MGRIRCLFAALACASACTSIHAGAPGLGGESAVAEAGDCEVELALERQRVRGEPSQRERSLRLACGIGANTELETAHARQRSSQARGEALAFEAKTTLRERGEGGFGLGWAAALGVEAERRDGRWRRSAQALSLEATRELSARWLAEATLGAARDVQARRNRTRWALAVEHALHERVELRAELEGDDRSQPFAALSLRYTLWPDDLQLKLSYAARGGSSRERVAGASLQLDF